MPERPTEGGFSELVWVIDGKHLDGVDFSAEAAVFDDLVDAKEVEKAKSIGGQVDGTADGTWLRTDLVDVDLGQQIRWGKFGEGDGCR